MHQFPRLLEPEGTLSLDEDKAHRSLKTAILLWPFRLTTIFGRVRVSSGPTLRVRPVIIDIVPTLDPCWDGIYQYSLTMLRALYEWKPGATEDEFVVFANEMHHPAGEALGFEILNTPDR